MYIYIYVVYICNLHATNYHITIACSIEAGRSAVPMDIEMGPNYDLSSNVGFANAMYQVCNLSPGTGHTSAPVCSTFVWMPLVIPKRNMGSEKKCFI